MLKKIQFWGKSAAIIAVFVLSINYGFTATVTWNGSVDNNWSTDANWSGTGFAPTSSDTPLFTTNNSSGISILDGTDDRTVNGLLVKNPNGSTIASDISHTLNLNNNVLTVDGDISVGSEYTSIISSRGLVTWVVTNGTLQIGSASDNKNLTVGKTSNTQDCEGDFIMADGTTLDAYLETVTIGYGAGGKGVIDLRKLTTMKCGDETGIFRTEVLSLAYGGSGQNERYNSELLLGSAITSLEITSNLSIADGQKTSAWIGQYGSEGTAVMPDNVDIKLGVDADNRSEVVIAKGGYWGTKAHLIAGSGGTFTGYLSNLTVGKKNTGGSGSSTGRLDLRNMTSATLDVSGDTIIGSSYDASKLGYGYLYLPSGTATFNNLTISSTWGEGLLDLYGTDVTVNNALNVNATGSVDVRVDAAGGSLTIASGATLTLLGNINVIFQAEPPTGEMRYGFKVPGDQRATLVSLNDDGKLTWDTTGLTATAGIYYDKTNTFVALMETWPLSVIPHNRTIEVKPDVPTTLVFDIDDLDATPDDQGVTSREITNPADLTPGDPHKVTLPAITMTAGATSTNINITLTLYKNTEKASDDAVVIVLPVPTGTSSDLTWSGLAGASLIPQHEWLWGKNWEGDTPPEAITTGTLSFNNNGTGTNLLSQARTVGGLNIFNDTGVHTFDLNGNTLTIDSGTLQVGNNNFTTETVFTNGTLYLADSDIILNSLGGSWSRLIAKDVILDGNIGTLRLGDAINSASYGYGELDMQSSTLSGGLLSAVNLEVGYAVNRGNTTFPRGNLLLSESTGLQRIVVTNAFRISDGHRVGQSRFGDPSNSYKLPTNINIEIGVDYASRGLLRVGTSLYGGDFDGQADGYLAASSGGTFNAWLSEFTVGQGGIGIVNFTNMTSVAIDTTLLQLAIDSFFADSGSGQILLPTGSLFVGTLTSGSNGSGLLDLYGTDMTVTNSLTLGAGGTINVRPGVSNGTLTMASTATLTLDDASRIYLTYNEETRQAGILWEGDHFITLSGYMTGGQIVIDGSYSSKVELYTNGGDTYIGVPPPSGTIFFIK